MTQKFLTSSYALTKLTSLLGRGLESTPVYLFVKHYTIITISQTKQATEMPGNPALRPIGDVFKPDNTYREAVVWFCFAYSVILKLSLFFLSRKPQTKHNSTARKMTVPCGCPEMQQRHPGMVEPPSPSSVTTSITSGTSCEKGALCKTVNAEIHPVVCSNPNYSARSWSTSQKVAVSVGAIACFLVM